MLPDVPVDPRGDKVGLRIAQDGDVLAPRHHGLESFRNIAHVRTGKDVKGRGALVGGVNRVDDAVGFTCSGKPWVWGNGVWGAIASKSGGRRTAQRHTSHDVRLPVPNATWTTA